MEQLINFIMDSLDLTEEISTAIADEYYNYYNSRAKKAVQNWITNTITELRQNGVSDEELIDAILCMDNSIEEDPDVYMALNY